MDTKYSLEPFGSNLTPAEAYTWWDIDEPETFQTQRRKKHKKKKKRKKQKKQKKQQFAYQLIDKTADVLLSTTSDVIKMYAASKFQRE
jgi:hypothetical protein